MFFGLSFSKESSSCALVGGMVWKAEGLVIWAIRRSRRQDETVSAVAASENGTSYLQISKNCFAGSLPKYDRLRVANSFLYSSGFLHDKDLP